MNQHSISNNSMFGMWKNSSSSKRKRSRLAWNKWTHTQNQEPKNEQSRGHWEEGNYQFHLTVWDFNDYRFLNHQYIAPEMHKTVSWKYFYFAVNAKTLFLALMHMGLCVKRELMALVWIWILSQFWNHYKRWYRLT